MSQIILSSSTGRPEIDEILQSVIGIFNLAFPERIRAYYIGGSYAIVMELTHETKIYETT